MLGAITNERVGWVERSDTHHVLNGDGFREGLTHPALAEASALIRRHCEERSDEAIHSFFARRDGMRTQPSSEISAML
jgi:hypothetical protein